VRAVRAAKAIWDRLAANKQHWTGAVHEDQGRTWWYFRRADSEKGTWFCARTREEKEEVHEAAHAAATQLVFINSMRAKENRTHRSACGARQPLMLARDHLVPGPHLPQAHAQQQGWGLVLLVSVQGSPTRSEFG
jgi:hypothetical protein